MSAQRQDNQCSTCQGCTKCSFLTALPKEMHAPAHRAKSTYDVERGELVFHQGEHPKGIWVICMGRVKIFRQSADGKALVTRTAQSGEMVGYRTFFSGQPFQASGEAMEKTRVSFFEGSFIHSLVATCGDFSFKMLTRLARDLATAENMATNMAYRSAHDRVLDVLYDYHQRNLGDGLTGMRFVIPRRELAELAGLTVETIVRVLRVLEKEGYVTTDGRQINVIDTQKLLDSVLSEHSKN